MTLKQLEDALDNLSRVTDTSWYALKEDSELIRMLVNDEPRSDINEYINNTYGDWE